MTEQKTFPKLQNLSGYIALIIFLLAMGINQITSQATLNEVSKHQQKDIDYLKENSLPVNLFIAWAATYDLQLEEAMAIKADDQEAIKNANQKYRDLRNSIIRLTSIQTRSETKK